MPNSDYYRNNHNSRFNNNRRSAGNRPQNPRPPKPVPAPEEPVVRTDRPADELRPLEMIPQCNKWAEGSCLIRWGDTQVMCTATLEDKVPAWVKGTGMGWVTAEYGMLPRSTDVRMDRESKKGQQGRTHEIQRLIGRSLRGCVNLRALDGLTIKIDCDVIQADGGTRTASVTGGFMALFLALVKLAERRKWDYLPVKNFVAAVSCGIVNRVPLLDLDYREDSHAETDANFVINERGGIIEIQGTAERTAFTPEEYTQLMALAQKGVKELIRKQQQVLEGVLGYPVSMPEKPAATDNQLPDQTLQEPHHDEYDTAGDA